MCQIFSYFLLKTPIFLPHSNKYSPLVCVSSSVTTFTLVVIFACLGHEGYLQPSVRLSAFNVICLCMTFLLISVASILNHFKPSIYLRLSLMWRHKLAIPIMLIGAISAEHLLHGSCEAGNSTGTKFYPLPVTSFVQINKNIGN